MRSARPSAHRQLDQDTRCDNKISAGIEADGSHRGGLPPRVARAEAFGFARTQYESPQQRRYMTLESLAEVSDNPPASLPTVTVRLAVEPNRSA